MSTTDDIDPMVRDHLYMRAAAETNAEGIIVEATESGTKVRLLYHPINSEPVLMPISLSATNPVFRLVGVQQNARKLSREEAVEKFDALTNADHIDMIDCENHYEVQLVYEDTDPRW